MVSSRLSLTLTLSQRESPLAHRISLLRIGWGEGVRRTDEVRLGSGEGGDSRVREEPKARVRENG